MCCPSCLVCVCLVTPRFAQAADGGSTRPNPPWSVPPPSHMPPFMHAWVAPPGLSRSSLFCLSPAFRLVFLSFSPFPSQLPLSPSTPSCSSTFLVPRQHRTPSDPFRQSGIMAKGGLMSCAKVHPRPRARPPWLTFLISERSPPRPFVCNPFPSVSCSLEERIRAETRTPRHGTWGAYIWPAYAPVRAVCAAPTSPCCGHRLIGRSHSP